MTNTTTFTMIRREKVGRRFCQTVDVTIASGDTLPLVIAPESVMLRRLDDVRVIQCSKSDFTQGYNLQWDPIGKQIFALGSNGATPDLVRDTTANNALVIRIEALGV